jgi:hypothetical protein
MKEDKDIQAEEKCENIKLEPLDEKQQKIAKELVRKLYPLRKEPMEVVLPFLCCCLKLCKKNKYDGF